MKYNMKFSFINFRFMLIYVVNTEKKNSVPFVITFYLE